MLHITLSHPGRLLAAMWLLHVAIAGAISAPAAVAEEPPAFSAGTAFTYQGSLNQNGRPAEGTFDLSFELFDANSDGRSFGQIDLFEVPVEGGAFAVELDFLRSVFSGEPVWLETQVRSAGNGAYTTLLPREKLGSKAAAACSVDGDVRISGTLDVSSSLRRLQIVGNGIQVFDNNDLPESLFLNVFGGDVLLTGSSRLGIGILGPQAPLHLPPTPEVDASGGGALIVGDVNNIAIDGNEIQAHSSGAPSRLVLNDHGGDVRIGGRLGIGVERVSVVDTATTVDAACPSGKLVISGGCNGSGAGRGFPLAGGTAWRCLFDSGAIGNVAVAVCGRIAW